MDITLTKEHTKQALNPLKSLGTVSIDMMKYFELRFYFDFYEKYIYN